MPALCDWSLNFKKGSEHSISSFMCLACSFSSFPRERSVVVGFTQHDQVGDGNRSCVTCPFVIHTPDYVHRHTPSIVPPRSNLLLSQIFFLLHTLTFFSCVSSLMEVMVMSTPAEFRWLSSGCERTDKWRLVISTRFRQPLLPLTSSSQV